MAGSGTTPIRARPYPELSDAPDVATDIQALADNLDTAPTVGVGTLASRPTPSAPGNRYFVYGDSTAANNGIEWLDTGSAWVLPAPHVQPTGTVAQYAGSADPVDPDGNTRWFICDGRSLVRTTYPTLFGVISTAYGTVDGSHFNIPNIEARVIVGAGSGYTLAAIGGESQHLLTLTEIPAHTHPITQTDGTYTGGQASSGDAYQAMAAFAGGNAPTGSAGGGVSHNNMQPYIVLNHIIKVT